MRRLGIAQTFGQVRRLRLKSWITREMIEKVSDDSSEQGVNQISPDEGEGERGRGRCLTHVAAFSPVSALPNASSGRPELGE